MESEAKYSDRSAETNELVSTLETRVNEAKKQFSKLGRKLGKARINVEHTFSSDLSGNSTEERQKKLVVPPAAQTRRLCGAK